MQRVDFFRLDRPIQERFVAATRGASPPLPLAVAEEPLPRSVVTWAAVALAALAALALVCRIGFGELQSSWALQPSAAVGLYAFSGALLLHAGARAYQALRARRSLPFAPALYLFPSGLIDTRGSEFVVRPLSELASVDVRDRALSLTFADQSRFTFSTPSAERGAELKRALEEFRDRLGPDIAPVSARELALLDPLCDNGFKNPFSPSESMLPPRARGLKLASLGAVALGAALGVGVWKLRNALAADALYREARTVESRDAYLAYVARGGTRPEVSEILLPRAELAEAVGKRSVEALEDFRAKHPGSKIAPEIEAALHQALAAELDRARRAGTITALQDFKRRYGGHANIRADVERAVAENWQARLSAFDQSAHPKPEVLAFFRRLLAYAVEHGSRVEIRFRRRLPESVEKAELVLRKSLHFAGEASLPAQYFDAEHASAREKPVAADLLAALGQSFPKDLLDFQLGPALPDSPEDLPAVKVPTLLVTHRTEMSGAYLLRKPRAALTGIGVLFRVTFQIPNDANAHVYKYSSWSSPDLKQAAEAKNFGEIYDEMATRGFQKLSRRYLAELLPGLTD